MKNTESHFGLIEIDGKISADDGNTYLPKYADMSNKDFDELVGEIEHWLEHDLTSQELIDLKEILK